MSRHYCKAKGNANAQQEITVLVQKAAQASTLIKSRTVAKILNERNHSRAYDARRVGCLLRGRDDVELVSDGIWRPVGGVSI